MNELNTLNYFKVSSDTWFYADKIKFQICFQTIDYVSNKIYILYREHAFTKIADSSQNDSWEVTVHL